MDSPRLDQLEVALREKQEVLDTGQHQYQPMMQARVDKNSMSIDVCVDPEFLAHVPFADDSDAEDCEADEETTIFPPSRPVSLHIANGQLPQENATLRLAPLVVQSPVSSLQYGQLPAETLAPAPQPNGHLPTGAPAAVPQPNGHPPITAPDSTLHPNGHRRVTAPTFAPHSNGLPVASSDAPYPPVFTLTTPGQDDQMDDDVFVAAEPPGRKLSAAEKMFAEMTAPSPHPRLRKQSSDPFPDRIEKEVEKKDLFAVHSLPLTKQYSCIKEYKQEEKREVNEIIRDKGISVCASEDSIAAPTEQPKKKERRRFASFSKRFSKSSKKKKARVHKKGGGMDGLLCSSGNREDKLDVMACYEEDDKYHKHSKHATLKNGLESDMSDAEKLEKLLRQGARSRRVNETIPEGGSYDEHTESTSKWDALKHSISKITGLKRTKHKHSLLLLKAPVNKKRVDYKKDEHARKMEYAEFCRLYPGLEDNSVQKTEETVNTSDDIEHCIKKFFKKGASHAVMAVIIFNGHGSEKGLSLSKDDPLPLDTFITMVSDLLKEHRQHHDCHLPHLVKIVFAQCHGHLYQEPAQHDIHVISFTSPTAPKTRSQIKVNPLTRQEEKREHKQLTSFASQSSLAEDNLEKIRSRSRNTSVCSLLNTTGTSSPDNTYGKTRRRNLSGVSNHVNILNTSHTSSVEVETMVRNPSKSTTFTLESHQSSIRTVQVGLH